MVNIPFHPDHSVIIYGLCLDEEKEDRDRVVKLFANTLEVNVNILRVDRTKPRGNNMHGVVKVELSCLEEKIEVLRAKRKCEDMESNDRIIIKTCESHIERVVRINPKFLLTNLELNENYTITGHRLIKPKKDDSADDEVLEGGAGRGVTETEEAEGGGDAPGASGDNGAARDNSAADGDEGVRKDPKDERERPRRQIEPINGKQAKRENSRSQTQTTYWHTPSHALESKQQTTEEVEGA